MSYEVHFLGRPVFSTRSWEDAVEKINSRVELAGDGTTFDDYEIIGRSPALPVSIQFREDVWHFIADTLNDRMENAVDLMGTCSEDEEAVEYLKEIEQRCSALIDTITTRLQSR